MNTAFFFVIGKMEESYIPTINEFLKTNNGEILFNKSFRELISYFHNGDLFISNDTGAVHIAQMMGKKCVILYSSEFQDVRRVIGEWFLKSDKSRFIISEKVKI